MDCSPPGSTVYGVLQARILEWVAISFSRGSSQPRDYTWASCLAGGFFTTEPLGKPEVGYCYLQPSNYLLSISSSHEAAVSLQQRLCLLFPPELPQLIKTWLLPSVFRHTIKQTITRPCVLLYNKKRWSALGEHLRMTYTRLGEDPRGTAR